MPSHQRTPALVRGSMHWGTKKKRQVPFCRAGPWATTLFSCSSAGLRYPSCCPLRLYLESRSDYGVGGVLGKRPQTPSKGQVGSTDDSRLAQLPSLRRSPGFILWTSRAPSQGSQGTQGPSCLHSRQILYFRALPFSLLEAPSLRQVQQPPFFSPSVPTN